MANEGKIAAAGSDLEDESPLHDYSQSKDQDGVPYCRLHHCRMHSRSSAAKTKGKDYYSCQVAGCIEKGVRIRTAIEKIVPPSPQACPRCSTDKTPVYCERDMRRSTASGVVLICPQCKWNAGMFALPQLEAMRLERRNDAPVEGVGDR